MTLKLQDYAGAMMNSSSGMVTAHSVLTPPTRPRGFKWLRAIFSLMTTLGALAGLGLFLAWMGGAFREKVPPGQSPASRPSATGRMLVMVESRRTPDTITAVGSVQPRKRTEVASQLLATVLEVRVRPGDRVATGDLLIVLDDRELLAQQREALAAQTAAEADLVTRKSDYERIKALRASGVVSQEEYNRIEGAYRVAEAQVVRAKEVLARLAVQLTHTKLSANTSGIVADRLIEPGDLATPGKPLLVIYDPADLELHANVPESLASAVSVGKTLTVSIDAVGLKTQGAVREVVPQAQQASRSILVKVGLPASTERPLLPGMFGRVEISIGEAERLWIPQAAVRQVGQLDLVDVAMPDGTLARRFVRLGTTQGEMVEVLSGLSAGERVALPLRNQSPRTSSSSGSPSSGGNAK